MGIDDILGTAKDLLDSDQGEQISDGILDKAAEFVENATGHKFDEAVEHAKQLADGAIGKE